MSLEDRFPSGVGIPVTNYPKCIMGAELRSWEHTFSFLDPALSPSLLCLYGFYLIRICWKARLLIREHFCFISYPGQSKLILSCLKCMIGKDIWGFMVNISFTWMSHIMAGRCSSVVIIVALLFPQMFAFLVPKRYP